MFYCLSVRRPTRLMNSFQSCFSLSLALFQCVVGQINNYISFAISLIRFMDKPEVKFQNQGQCTQIAINTETYVVGIFGLSFVVFEILVHTKIQSHISKVIEFQI